MKRSKIFIKKWTESLIVFLLPIISYLILGPLEIFFGNEKDFSFSYTDFFLYLCGISLGIWLIASILSAALPMKINRRISILVFGFGVASYIQNMFMNIKLSEDDGNPMRWEELGNYPIKNLVVWLLILGIVIGVSILAKKSWRTVSMGVSGFLCAIQVIAVVALIITALCSPEDVSELQMSGDEQFEIASKDNIIVFVLDTYGTVTFENMLDCYPETTEALADFTYYNNADCHYYCTFPSMTHMFTGVDFDFNAETSWTWMEQAWNSERVNGFFDVLRKAGYNSNLYSPDIKYVYGGFENLYGKFDNVKPVGQIVNREKLIMLLTKLSVYKYMPYVLKPNFEVLTYEFGEVVVPKESRAVIHDNGDFYQTLVNEGISIKENMNKAFVVQHLVGIHYPYTIDERANAVEDASREQTAKGLMVIVEEYIHQLKELNKYDDSIIIITADHGAWNGGDTQPIFLLKEKKETHEKMEISTAPISLDDFQATILALLKKKYDEYGTSVFDWKDGDVRERTVYMRFTDGRYPDVKKSSYNVYYGYTYVNNGEELNQKIAEGDCEVLPATPW